MFANSYYNKVSENISLQSRFSLKRGEPAVFEPGFQCLTLAMIRLAQDRTAACLQMSSRKTTTLRAVRVVQFLGCIKCFLAVPVAVH